MSENSEQRLGYVFGLVGALLIGLGGLLAVLMGVADAIAGRTLAAFNSESAAVVWFVVAGLAAAFAWMGRREWSTRPLTSGVLLVALAVVAWAVVGVNSSLLAVIGALFVFLAGLLYLLEPAKKAVGQIAAA